MSARYDGRGHWPAGVRRHADCPAALRRRLIRALKAATRDRRLRPLARESGMSDRQLRRYRDGLHWPPAETARALLAMI